MHYTCRKNKATANQTNDRQTDRQKDIKRDRENKRGSKRVCVSVCVCVRERETVCAGQAREKGERKGTMDLVNILWCQRARRW